MMGHSGVAIAKKGWSHGTTSYANGTGSSTTSSTMWPNVQIRNIDVAVEIQNINVAAKIGIHYEHTYQVKKLKTWTLSS